MRYSHSAFVFPRWDTNAVTPCQSRHWDAGHLAKGPFTSSALFLHHVRFLFPDTRRIDILFNRRDGSDISATQRVRMGYYGRCLIPDECYWLRPSTVPGIVVGAVTGQYVSDRYWKCVHRINSFGSRLPWWLCITTQMFATKATHESHMSRQFCESTTASSGIQAREPQSTYSHTEIHGSKNSKENMELKFQQRSWKPITNMSLSVERDGNMEFSFVGASGGVVILEITDKNLNLELLRRREYHVLLWDAITASIDYSQGVRTKPTYSLHPSKVILFR